MTVEINYNCDARVIDNDFTEGYNYVYIIQVNTINTYPCGLPVVKTKKDQEIVFTDIPDGFYSLCRIKLTTDKNDKYWIKDGKYYKGDNEVQLQELVDINYAASNIFRTYVGFFSTCKLRKSYFDICSEILVNTSNCINKQENQQLMYKRNLFQSAYTVVLYLLDLGKYHEAQEIIERISGCNGLYKNGCICG